MIFPLPVTINHKLHISSRDRFTKTVSRISRDGLGSSGDGERGGGIKFVSPRPAHPPLGIYLARRRPRRTVAGTMLWDCVAVQLRVRDELQAR